MAVAQRPPATDGTSSQPGPIDADLLFREAKQRERRRRLAWLGAGVIVVGGAVALVAATGTTPKTQAHQRSRVSSPRVATVHVAGPTVAPEHPYAMATAPDGTLYLIDSARDQVLRRMPSGRFKVFAGSGQRGFSGDGGPATDATINVESNSGLVVARNGTLYFADTSNGRVREVLPDGVIQTVIGGGSMAMTHGALPAREVALSGQSTVTGLAMGPGGDLYVAAGPVYRLEPSGQLQWVVGSDVQTPNDSAGVYANPAVPLDFAASSRIAFDDRGDLLDAGGGGWGLYERTASGQLRFIENFRGDGYWGSLAPGPGGSIALVSGYGLALFHPSGALTSITARGLNSALGSSAHNHNVFIGGDGIAVAPSGAIYIDTNTGNTFTTVSAILVITPQGRVKVVWKS
jgi:hypothetical protein